MDVPVALIDVRELASCVAAVRELASCVAAIVRVEPMVTDEMIGDRTCLYCDEERDHTDACPWWRLKRLIEKAPAPQDAARPLVVL